MKIQCEGCEALVEPAVRAGGSGEMELVCPECAHVNVLGGAPAPAPEERAPVASLLAAAAPVAQAAQKLPQPDPVAVLKGGLVVPRGEGEVRCPKCGYRQDDALACHRCGLVFGASGDKRFDGVSEAQREEAEALDREWEALVSSDAFLERGAHGEFIAFARGHGLLERAARHYRFYAQDHPDDPRGEEARRALGRIIEMMHAEFVLTAGAQGEDFPESVARIKRLLLVFAILMCVGVLGLALYIFGPF